MLQILTIRIDAMDRTIASLNDNLEKMGTSVSGLLQRPDPKTEIEGLRNSLTELCDGFLGRLLGEEEL